MRGVARDREARVRRVSAQALRMLPHQGAGGARELAGEFADAADATRIAARAAALEAAEAEAGRGGGGADGGMQRG